MKHRPFESDVIRRLLLLTASIALVISGLTFSRFGDHWIRLGHHYRWSTKLSHPDSQIRREALRILRSQGESCVPDLVALTRHENPTIRSFAAVELGYEAPWSPAALQAVRTLLNDPDPIVRSSCAYSIGKMAQRNSGQPHPQLLLVLPELVRLAHDENLLVRIQSVDALGEFSEAGQPALADLEKLLEDSNDLVRVRAAQSMAQINPLLAGESVDVLTNVLLGENARARLEAMTELPELGPSRSLAVPTIVRILQDPSDALRNRAATTLGQLGRESETAVQSLIEALEDPDSQFVDHVIDALGNLGPSAKPAVPALRELSRQHPEFLAEIEAAIEQIDPMEDSVSMMTT